MQSNHWHPMRVNGVPITVLSLGHLSSRLRSAGHRGLADRLNAAIGYGELDVTVTDEERATIVGVLEPVHPSLTGFKTALTDQR
jgi:hypothetical protein